MKKNKIGKVILIIFMSLIIAGIAYMGSYYIDKLYKYYGVDLKKFPVAMLENSVKNLKFDI